MDETGWDEMGQNRMGHPLHEICSHVFHGEVSLTSE